MKIPTTIPPWHNYTGPSRKSRDFSAIPVTWLDWLSKAHDEAVASSTIIGTFKNTRKESLQNMNADIMFGLTYFITGGAVTLFAALGLFYSMPWIFHIPSVITLLIPLYINWYSTENKWLRPLFMIGNSVVDLIVGAFGIVFLFIPNIVLNAINWLRGGA